MSITPTIIGPLYSVLLLVPKPCEFAGLCNSLPASHVDAPYFI